MDDAVATGSGNDATSVAVNLLGVKLEDHAGHVAGLLPAVLAYRERTGRQFSVVVNEANHILPAAWTLGVTAMHSGLPGLRNSTCPATGPATHEDVFGAPGHQSLTAE